MVDAPPNNNSRIILEEYVKCDNDERRVDGRPPKAGGRLVILKKKQLSVRANVASTLWLTAGKIKIILDISRHFYVDISGQSQIIQDNYQSMPLTDGWQNKKSNVGT